MPRSCTTRRSPGGRQAAQALALTRPGAESALETLCRLCVVSGGLPEPELQVRLSDRDGLIGRVDMLFRQQRVVLEADGLVKYTDPLVLRDEKLREDRLRHAGYEVVRVTWDELWHRPQVVLARLRRAFARAELRRPA